jgi:uncharacterized protein YbjT (DUF2867 family)
MVTLVFGGTGKVGAVAVKRLADSGQQVRVYTRTPEKIAAISPAAEAFAGDLDNPGDFGTAFRDVESVILITQVNAAEEARGMPVIEAAKKAGVKYIAFLSLVQGAWSESIPFYKSKLVMEAAIKASGMKWAIVRAAGFMQTDATLKTEILDKGVFSPPIGDVGVARIDTRDVGYAMAEAVLTKAEGEFRVFGPEILSGDKVAAIYTKVLGKPVKYLGNDLDQWAKFKDGAFPPWSLNALRNMYAYSQVTGMVPEPGEAQCKLLPAKPRTFESFVNELKAAWRV